MRVRLACRADEEKDAFYEDLAQAIHGVCSSDLLVVLGDFNAHLARPAMLPWYGNRGLVVKANRNREELARVAVELDLVAVLEGLARVQRRPAEGLLGEALLHDEPSTLRDEV